MSDLIVSRADGVVSIVLNRPGKLNAITDPMWEQLGREFALIADHDVDRAVVISGAGGVFSAGSDVSGFVGHSEPLADRIEACNEALLALHELPIPTVASVDGIAGGSGANLALLCDFVIASERSAFAELFTNIGLSLDTGSSWLLPRLIGERRAREVALLGDWVSASTAADWGLINSVVSDRHLKDACDALLQRLLRLPRDATAGTKRLLSQSWDRTLSAAFTAETENQLRVIEAADAQAAITAFVAKTRKGPAA